MVGEGIKGSKDFEAKQEEWIHQTARALRAADRRLSEADALGAARILSGATGAFALAFPEADRPHVMSLMPQDPQQQIALEVAERLGIRYY